MDHVPGHRLSQAARGARMALRLHAGGAEVSLLVQEKDGPPAREFRPRRDGTCWSATPRPCTGASPPPSTGKLTAGVTDVLHAHELSALGAPRDEMRRVNLTGTAGGPGAGHRLPQSPAVHAPLHRVRLRRPGGDHRRGRAGPAGKPSAIRTRRRNSRPRSWCGARWGRSPPPCCGLRSWWATPRRARSTVSRARMRSPSSWSPARCRSPCLSRRRSRRPLNAVPIDYVVGAPARRSTRTPARGTHLPPGRPESVERAARVRDDRAAQRKEAAAPVARVQADRRAAQAARAGAAHARAARRHRLRQPSQLSIPAGTPGDSWTGPASAARPSRATWTT